jgi:hypothetical protein
MVASDPGTSSSADLDTIAEAIAIKKRWTAHQSTP